MSRFCANDKLELEKQVAFYVIDFKTIIRYGLVHIIVVFALDNIKTKSISLGPSELSNSAQRRKKLGRELNNRTSTLVVAISTIVNFRHNLI